jgi:hypothetical protein
MKPPVFWYDRRMASIFDQIGAQPPRNATPEQLEDWAAQQSSLEALRAALPPGTPLDLPAPVLQAIAGGGYSESQRIPPAQFRDFGEPPSDPSSSADVGAIGQALTDLGAYRDTNPPQSMRRGGQAIPALALAELHRRMRAEMVRRGLIRGALSSWPR